MKIRERFWLRDRVKIIIILSLVALMLLFLSLQKAETNKATIENLLGTALEPVGSTMYIWGGGWNDEDSKEGAGATRIGVSPRWKRFARQQDENYDYTKYLYQREKGLDCSGYVGWVLYNTFESESGQSGYVTTSTDMARSLSERGWGELLQNPDEFLPGDIVSMDGHVWICLGTCEDGSVLLVHSSPPGVSVCGTPVPQERRTDEYDGESIAVGLAREYMTENHHDWQERYPGRSVSDAYLKNVSVFRWNKSKMRDMDEYQILCGEEVLKRISY